MCGHRELVQQMTYIIPFTLIGISFILWGLLGDHRDVCTIRTYINQMELCVTPCYEKILIVVTLNLYLNTTNSKFITNVITATTSDSSVLKVVTQDNIYWSVFENEELLSFESVPTEGYRFGGWSLKSLDEFKVSDEECNSLTTLSDTTVARTTAGEIISYKPNSKT